MRKAIKIILLICISNILNANQDKNLIPIKKLKEPLYLTYQEYLFFKENEIFPVSKNIKYYKHSSYESLKNSYDVVEFFEQIPKEVALKRDNYVKVYFSRGRPTNFKIVKKDRYINILLDKKSRIISEYNNYDKSLIVHLLDKNSFVLNVSCNIESNKRICYINYLHEDKNSVHYDAVKEYKEFPGRLLTREYYQSLIKEKRGKAYFRKLLQEEEKRSATSIQYFKSFKLKDEKVKFVNPLSSLNMAQYIKVFYKDKKPILAQWYQDSHLTKSIKLNDLAQVKEIIDFETKSIKEYRYGRKNHGIDEIECFYLKDMCRVKEVSKIELK